ncbi:calmodulin-binding receptor-like cytoplasmic kinase 2 [Papaver somniferum]|uniref:calmodulin-binding receptor-like cytoplasmic kinase 2 n=1 Tax=Papaver somniferum TaxID=3469 RepID=UPI000E6F74AF|nr:calmodulin-binding receptor-like cytoplasmic kinase 2 [Papaver somniferum]
MRSSGSNYRNQRPSSDGRGQRTPDFSDISRSPINPNTNSGGNGQNPVKTVAKSVVAAFSSCFSPPEPKSDTFFDESDVHTASSAASDKLGSGTDEKPNSRRTILNYSYRSTKTTEPGSAKFTMAEIYKATRNFSPSLKVGQGGFGTVYKGKLDDGTLVAVKRAKKSVYEKHLGVEFQSEIQTLAKVEHLNLVRLHGYLEQGDERIVVVEYVPNGTLRSHLDCINGIVLDFAIRLDIVIDVAHAITYLHMYTDHPIIHRDIKSSNILLTENLRAKVADFGFARLAADTDSGATHVSTQVKGTAGYLDPEYLQTYQLTEKSDVYSFGVLLVEVVTGRRPIEPKRELKERLTSRWAMKKFNEGDAVLTMDPRLHRSAATSLAVEKIFELAFQCLAPTRQNRPSMKRCAEILWGIRKDLKEHSAFDSRSFSSQSQTSSSIKE